ncbi:trypsin-like peptidase domain-containing protein [Streptosporangium sp. CA-135522]|uniref:trypsin-like peptidase domain-containing protein n=1 Tax=Streptosporangium sp. CA-135522 TaxID=3240072 RepID=UPI003D93FC3C
MDGFSQLVIRTAAALALAVSGCGSGTVSQGPSASPATSTSTTSITSATPAAPPASPAPSGSTTAPPPSPSPPASAAPSLPGRGPAPVTAEERASALVRPAIVFVEVRWSGYLRNEATGQLWGSKPIKDTSGCTGFFVNPDGYLVTAGHCVDPGIEGITRSFFDEVIDQERANGNPKTRAELDRDLVGNWVAEGQVAGTPPDREVRVRQTIAGPLFNGDTPGEAPTTGTASPSPMGGRSEFARVIMFEPSSEGDLALLKIEGTNLPSVELAPESAVEIGTPVLAIGYPGPVLSMTDQVLEPSNKDGKVSAKSVNRGLPLYEISAAVTNGMSGGPAVETASAQVIGVLFYRARNEQPFNYASPSSLVRELLGRSGVRNRLGPVDGLYRTALQDYWAGDYAGAVRGFDAVLAQVPAHPQAKEYRAMAAGRMAGRPGPSPS